MPGEYPGSHGADSDSPRETAAGPTGDADPPLEAAFEALADEKRRFVVRFLDESPSDAVSVRELADAFAARYRRSADDAAVALHHAALPKLDDAGVVEYDPTDRVVRLADERLTAACLRLIARADDRERA